MHVKKDILEAAVVGLCLFAVIVVLGRGFGPYWDSWFYYDQAARWGEWFASWWSGRSVPSLISQPTWYFPDQTEYARHPPFLEIGGGFFNALFGNRIGQLSSCRLIVELLTSTFSATCYLFLKPRTGRGLAILGILLFWGSPRFFLHSVLFAIDGLIAAVYGITLLSFLLWDKGAWGKGTLFACLVLGLLTKLQALYLFPILFLWLACKTYLDRERGEIAWLKKLMTEWGKAMGITVGALVTAFLLWPANWLNWPEGFKAYLEFITRHSNIPVLYFGTLYKGTAHPPWHYPWVYTLIAVPLWTTLPVIVRGVRQAISLLKDRPGKGVAEEILLWLGMLFPLLVSSMPGAPKYDGIRLLLPAYGPMTLLAALEIAGWWNQAMNRYGQALSGIVRPALLGLLMLLVILPSMRIYPHNLVYYSPLIGGPKGAHAAGFELEYLGVTLHHLNPVLAEKARPGDILLLAGANAVVHPDPNESWPPLPKGIHIVDFKMLRELNFKNRQVFAILSSRYADLRETGELVLEKVPPLATVEYQGERLFSLHQIPESFVKQLPERLKEFRSKKE